MSTLHHSVLDGEIKTTEYRDERKLKEAVERITDKVMRSDIVLLIVINEDIFVTENFVFVDELFEKKLTSVYPYYEDNQIAIYEFPSYEEAYKVALDIREPNPLCYSK